ncbi:MAG: 2OG-Fe(II) oxygenase [Bryobacterales bacterium]|nr:2OG-Fe(II) oxygenase [Bryobacterales bacterium]
MPSDLFSDLAAEHEERLELAPEAILLRGAVKAESPELFSAIMDAARISPFRHMAVRGGFRMSVAMTNCGHLGWTSDEKGYRYSTLDPETGKPWPAMPPLFAEVASRCASLAGFADFEPDACLINRYKPDARMTLHQDKNEVDMSRPIVSVSLGLPATFLFGGMTRKERPRRIRIESGDVVAWGGAARLTYHGIAALAEGDHPLTGPFRYNLTFRKAG